MFTFIYLSASDLGWLGLFAAWEIFRCGMQNLSCGMWDLVPWPEIKPELPALGAWGLSHWTTREVPFVFSILVPLAFLLFLEQSRHHPLECTLLNTGPGTLLTRYPFGQLPSLLQVLLKSHLLNRLTTLFSTASSFPSWPCSFFHDAFHLLICHIFYYVNHLLFDVLLLNISFIRSGILVLFTTHLKPLVQYLAHERHLMNICWVFKLVLE